MWENNLQPSIHLRHPYARLIQLAVDPLSRLRILIFKSGGDLRSSTSTPSSPPHSNRRVCPNLSQSCNRRGKNCIKFKNYRRNKCHGSCVYFWQVERAGQVDVCGDGLAPSSQKSQIWANTMFKFRLRQVARRRAENPAQLAFSSRRSFGKARSYRPHTVFSDLYQVTRETRHQNVPVNDRGDEKQSEQRDAEGHRHPEVLRWHQHIHHRGDG